MVRLWKSSDNQNILIGAIAAILLAEAVTIACRIRMGSATTFIETDPPFLLQIHHMFWATPFIVYASARAVLGRDSLWPWIIAIGLIGSDLMHHFIVLPLWVGHTGWHWP